MRVQVLRCQHEGQREDAGRRRHEAGRRRLQHVNVMTLRIRGRTVPVDEIGCHRLYNSSATRCPVFESLVMVTLISSHLKGTERRYVQ